MEGAGGEGTENIDGWSERGFNYLALWLDLCQTDFSHYLYGFSFAIFQKTKTLCWSTAMSLAEFLCNIKPQNIYYLHYVMKIFYQ